MQLLATEERESMLLTPEGGFETPVVARAGAADLEPIKELFREAFEINHPNGDWRKVRRAMGMELKKAVEEQKVLGDQVVLVARSAKGDFLGYIWWKYGIAPDAVPEALIAGVGVKHEFRKLGVATLLVSAMVQWVHRNLSGLKKPVRRVTCAVSPRNGSVIRVIEKMGGRVKFVICSRDIEPLEV
jgi:GNAT superfamily N-acetyltransferase